MNRSREKLVELIETLKSLRMEVNIYKSDNERIIRAQKEHKCINTHLL